MSRALDSAKAEPGNSQQIPVPAQASAQARLAARLACSQQAVSDYLHGASVPTASRVRLYAHVLAIDPVELAAICAHDRAIGRDRRRRLADAFHRRQRRAVTTARKGTSP